MANNNTYTWKIAALEAYPTHSSYTDMVYNIHWRYNAVNTNPSYSAEVYGVQSVAPYNPDSGSYIPYSQLTQQTVVTWLTDAMGQERVNNLTASLDSQISKQINPESIILPPPW